MPIEWPESLPNPDTRSLFETALETKVQDESEVGAPRQRNRFTRILSRFEFELFLTGAQRETLLEFYDVELVRGVHSFTWQHPTSGKEYLVTMRRRPDIDHETVDFWRATIELDEI